MAAYLTVNPGKLRQYSARTNWRPSRPTGLTVLHTTEFPPSWTVAQQAAWLRARTDPGCYHDIADTRGEDLHLVDYQFGAWQDGTGSNGMAMSIAFICRTTDWRQMTAEQRRTILRAGARAFARQQAWLRANGYPTTPLRLISKAQSDRGEAGLTYHGLRDPHRRTDPGTTPAAPFPFDEFITECRAVMSGEEDDMTPDQANQLAKVYSMLVDRWGPGERNMGDMLKDSYLELTNKLQSRAPGDGGSDTMLGFTVSAHAEAMQARKLAQATVDRLEAIVANGGILPPPPDGISPALPIDYDRLAEAIVAVQNRQARDGDPATGPAT